MSYIAAGNFEDKVCLFSGDQLVPLGAIARSAVVVEITACSCALFLPKFS